MKDKKTTTEGGTPAVVTPQESTNTTENIVVNDAKEVIAPEGANPAALIAQENTSIVQENSVDGNAQIESRKIGIKIITDEEVTELEAVVLEPLSFISESGNEYQITTPKFRFMGQEYDSQKAIDETPEVLEILIRANAFFIKKV